MTAADRTPSLSVFFPACNDGGTIASLVIQAVKAAGRLTPDYEVIVVASIVSRFQAPSGGVTARG